MKSAQVSGSVLGKVEHGTAEAFLGFWSAFTTFAHEPWGKRQAKLILWAISRAVMIMREKKTQQFGPLPPQKKNN